MKEAYIRTVYTVMIFLQVLRNRRGLLEELALVIVIFRSPQLNLLCEEVLLILPLFSSSCTFV